MVKQARQTLPDAENPGNSAVSRFNLAYDASHFLALAALRWHGYRSDNRQINFQSLVHTVGFAPVKWRILDNCHKKRNVAQYDGDFSPDEELISELIAVTKELQAAGPLSVPYSIPSQPAGASRCFFLRYVRRQD